MTNPIITKLVAGTSYDTTTPPKVISALERAKYEKLRVRLFFGDMATGLAWPEENDVIGYIGRSTGTTKVPLLMHNAASTGGPAISCQAIVAIKSGKEWLYRHPHFSPGVWEYVPSRNPLADLPHGVMLNGKMHAQFRSKLKADHLIAFMTGERLTKN